MKRRAFSTKAAAVLIAAATATVLGTATAEATAVNKNLTYDCDIPIYGPATLTINVKVNIPATGKVGTPIKATGFKATAHIPHDIYDVFTPFGATQADGTANVKAKVKLANNTPPNQTLTINATIPLTQVPNPSGPDMLLPASGPVPAVTPNATGTATVSAGNFTALVTPRQANGDPTILGTLTVDCTVSGNAKLGTVVVTN